MVNQFPKFLYGSSHWFRRYIISAYCHDDDVVGLAGHVGQSGGNMLCGAPWVGKTYGVYLLIMHHRTETTHQRRPDYCNLYFVFVLPALSGVLVFTPCLACDSIP